MIVFAIFILSTKTDCFATVLRKVSDCIDLVPRVLSLASKKREIPGGNIQSIARIFQFCQLPEVRKT